MKRHARLAYALALSGLLGLAAPAFAQGPYSSPYGYSVQPLQVIVEGGAAATTGTTSDFLNSGWTLGGGVLWHPEPGPLALRTTLDYSRFGASREAIAQAATVDQTNVNGGFGEAVSLHVNGVYEWPLVYSPNLRPYVTAGIGGAYENVELTQTFARPGFACSWWVCGTTVFPEQAIVARNDTTRFDWNVGVGLDFAAGGWQSLFVEADFEHINTPQATTFVPIRIGIRF